MKDDGSHPTWVRGLKLKDLASQIIFMPSHPTWVRGLKLGANIQQSSFASVAPYVGAWIETIWVALFFA